MSDRSHSSCFRSLAWQNVACAYSVSSLKQIWELDYPPMLSIYSMWNKNIILAAWFSEPHKILLSKHRYDTDLKMKTNVIRVSSMSHCLCVQAQQTPIRIMILDWSLLGAIMNDGPAEWASVRPAGPLKQNERWLIRHLSQLPGPLLPERCSWKLLWWAHDLFNTCWCILH